jgi:hypothetical protein
LSEREPPPKYAKLTEAERWKYHTHVYAFRIVYLGAPETQRFWDGDPIPKDDLGVPGRPQQGRYFNADMIATEVSRLQATKDRQDGGAQRRHNAGNDPRNDPIIQAQRRAFAKLKGYPTWEAYLDAMWRDAVAHPHPDTGQPDALGAWRRSGFAGFCVGWRDRLIRNQMAAKREQFHKAAE